MRNPTFPHKLLILFFTLALLHRLTFSHPHPHDTPTKDDVSRIEILMPGLSPQEEGNWCRYYEFDKTTNIVGYDPKGKMPVTHHMLVYGCEEPGMWEEVWDCAEMSTHNVSDHAYKHGPVCAGSTMATILYAWGMDAPRLLLPPNVGFKVGPGTKINYIVVQVHYGEVSTFKPPNKNTDHSGVVLLTKDKDQPNEAGVYLILSEGIIPAHSTVYLESACPFNQDLVLHPFAFRTHTHSHGQVVTGYRVRNSEWTEIGRQNPTLPQMFYNVTTPGVTIESGDYLAARCTMVNNEDKDIYIGNTSDDEMCNFYIMFYVEGKNTAGQNYCISEGTPYFSWSSFFNKNTMNNLPKEASIVPGTTEVVKESGTNMKDLVRLLQNTNRDSDEVDYEKQKRNYLKDDLQERVDHYINDDEYGDGFAERNAQDLGYLDGGAGYNLARDGEIRDPSVGGRSQYVDEDILLGGYRK